MYPDTTNGLPDPDLQAGFYAGVTSKRLIAWIIDLVLTAMITALIVLFTAFVGLFFLPVLFLTVGFVYRVVSLAGSSATPGMRLMGIEFRDRFGHRFDLALAALHTLGYTLSISTLIVQMVSVILMLTSSRGQGLTDIVLGTAAINSPAA
ncbi:MAG: RDD family protein [Gemmobacter sp.]|nr:RDD family protein [Gemmobacter sp.]